MLFYPDSGLQWTKLQISERWNKITVSFSPDHKYLESYTYLFFSSLLDMVYIGIERLVVRLSCSVFWYSLKSPQPLSVLACQGLSLVSSLPDHLVHLNRWRLSCHQWSLPVCLQQKASQAKDMHITLTLNLVFLDAQTAHILKVSC